MSKLLDYLNILDKDAAAREAHNKDPKAAMTKHGLSDDEQNAVLSGDKQMLADAVGIPADELPAITVPNSTFDDTRPQAWECAAYLSQTNKQIAKQNRQSI